MKQIIVDTNAFLRLLLDDIPAQKKIFERLLQRAKDKEIRVLVPQIIIFEIEFILRKVYLVPKSKIIEKLQTLVAMSFLEIESRQLFATALGLYAKQTISFVDCFLLAKSKDEGYELFTFDQKLNKSKN